MVQASLRRRGTTTCAALLWRFPPRGFGVRSPAGCRFARPKMHVGLLLVVAIFPFLGLRHSPFCLWSGLFRILICTHLILKYMYECGHLRLRLFNRQIVEMRGLGRVTMKSLVRAIAVSERIELSGPVNQGQFTHNPIRPFTCGKKFTCELR